MPRFCNESIVRNSKSGNTLFQKLDRFPPSGEGSLERANLTHLYSATEYGNWWEILASDRFGYDYLNITVGVSLPAIDLLWFLHSYWRKQNELTQIWGLRWSQNSYWDVVETFWLSVRKRDAAIKWSVFQLLLKSIYLYLLMLLSKVFQQSFAFMYRIYSTPAPRPSGLVRLPGLSPLKFT
jgi:hypothetical protein